MTVLLMLGMSAIYLARRVHSDPLGPRTTRLTGGAAGLAVVWAGGASWDMGSWGGAGGAGGGLLIFWGGDLLVAPPPAFPPDFLDNLYGE